MALAGIIPPSPGPETRSYPVLMTRSRLRQPVDHLRVVRDRIRSRPAARLPYRFVVALVGVTLTLGGLLLVPLPGPGWLVVIAGLAVLASEFAWAQGLLAFVRRRLRAWLRWIAAQGLLVRGTVAAGSAALVVAAVYGSLLVLGVPAWVPDAVVPPLPGLVP